MQAHKEVWIVNGENIARWRREALDPTSAEPVPNYWRNVAFVLANSMSDSSARRFGSLPSAPQRLFSSLRRLWSSGWRSRRQAW